MNALANATSTNPILAIDLGKYKSVACVHDQGTGEIGFRGEEGRSASLDQRNLVQKIGQRCATELEIADEA